MLRVPLLSLWAGLWACHESDSSSLPLPQFENLGISALAVRGEGDLKVLYSFEFTDSRDLNLDGDQSDLIASIYDRSEGTVIELGLAVASFEEAGFGGDLISLVVDEEDQGLSDLNGDGDALDQVVFLYDHLPRQALNTHLARPPRSVASMDPVIGSEWILVPVFELAQGEQDLDGNGSGTDIVLVAFHSITRANFVLDVLPTSVPVARGDEFAILTAESSVDLNGDGDAADDGIFRLFHVSRQDTLDVPVDLARAPLPVADGWLGLVEESGQGQDLNGDGDQVDGVYQLFRPELGTVEPLGFSLNTNRATNLPHASERYLLLPIEESDGLDHNGDGDQLDILWGIYDMLLHEAHETGLVRGFLSTVPGFLGDTVALCAWEVAQDADLNGDGLVRDFVLHLFRDGVVENTGLDTWSFAQGVEGLLTLGRSESLADLDWNGDGDTEDQVLHLLDLETDALTNTGLACLPVISMTARRLLLLVEEDRLGPGGQDLNGDGDVGDDVFYSYDVASGVARNLQLAAAESTLRFGLTLEGDGVFLVSENGQSLDLNGDGDQQDGILYGLR